MGAERIVSLLFAFPTLGTLIYLALNPHSLNSGALAIVRFLAAICAGMAGYSFTGSLDLQTSFDKTQVKAAGGFAAFVLVLIIFFVGIPQVSSSDNVNRTVLNAGDRLSVGQQLISSNKCFTLSLQDDGSLVLYNKQGSSLWSPPETFQKNSSYAVMQRDGNFVIYGNDKSVIWASNTYQSGGSQLKVENDGNIAIYTPENTRVWETGTGGQGCR